MAKDETGEQQSPEIEEQSQIAQRRDKLHALREQGQPFPNDFRRTAYAGEIKNHYGESQQDDF